jgi:hypothetical protein
VALILGGWETPSMLNRYAIVVERDLEDAAALIGAIQHGEDLEPAESS